MRWLLYKLGYIPVGNYRLLYKAYSNLLAEMQETIEKHQLQSAWEQTKRERKARRYH